MGAVRDQRLMPWRRASCSRGLGRFEGDEASARCEPRRIRRTAVDFLPGADPVYFSLLVVEVAAAKREA